MRQLRKRALTFTTLLCAGCGSMPNAQEQANSAFDDALEADAQVLGQLQLPATGTTGVIHPVGHTDLCLDVVWGNNRDGTPVQISKCNGNDAQKWTRVGPMLKVYGDKCLNVTDGENRDGTRLQIWTCSGDSTEDDNNMWTISGSTVRWHKDNDKCLDVMSGQFKSGTPVQIWDCGGTNGKSNQRWTLPASSTGSSAATPAKTTTTTAPAAATGQTVASTGGQKSVAPNFEVGFHIDYDNASGKSGGATGFVSRTQVKPTLVANYVRAKSDGSFETSTAKYYADDAVKGGAQIISYAITAESASLTSSQLQGIKESIAYARGKGLSVQLRFGYEMNGYWSPANHNNDASYFKKMWAQLAPVAHAAGAYMVWCPNVAGNAPDTYKPWLPSDLTSIDKIGLDYYVELTTSQPTIAQADKIIAGIYPIVTQVNQAHQSAKTGRTVPFTFGETAVNIRDDRNNWGKGVNNETQLKKAWLQSLSDASLRNKYPLYKGFTWFDYYKTELSGGTTGTRYNNAFELSQDPQSAEMFRTWYQGLSR